MKKLSNVQKINCSTTYKVRKVVTLKEIYDNFKKYDGHSFYDPTDKQIYNTREYQEWFCYNKKCGKRRVLIIDYAYTDEEVKLIYATN